MNNWNVPISTKEMIMKDKNFNMALYVKTMLESNRSPNESSRYIYKNKFNESVKKYFEEGQERMAKKTIEKHWRYIRKTDFNLVQVENTENGIVYKLNYKSDDKYYITVDSDTLNKLLECCNANVVKTYLVLLYTCEKDIYKPVSQSWLCKQIGFSEGSRGRIKTILDFLKDDLKLIDLKIVNSSEYIGDREVNKKQQLIKLI